MVSVIGVITIEADMRVLGSLSINRVSSFRSASDLKDQSYSQKVN